MRNFYSLQVIEMHLFYIGARYLLALSTVVHVEQSKIRALFSWHTDL